MIEQSTENAFSTDNGIIKTEQPRSQSGYRLNQKPIASNTIPTVNQLFKQIKELDKKNTRIEELVSSIKKEIKNAVTTTEKTNHQFASDDSARTKEFHDEITRLQMQTQKIQQAINDVYKSKKSKKDKKSKKLGKKNKGSDKKSKKKAKSMKNKIQR